MENKPSLSVEKLSFSYEKGNAVIDNVSLQFAPSKITALLGANGCGKSTLLNLLSGVIKPQSGCIKLDGTDISKIKRNHLAKRIAVVHQCNQAPGDITVRKLVEAGRTPYKSLWQANRQADEMAVESALRDTDTLKLSERPVSSLSGGQLQRVWLAMALAQNTEILLLDEITTYLDIHYQLQMLHLIRDLNRKKEITVVIVLHDINQALEYCDEAVIMSNGNVLSQGESKTAVTKEVLDKAFNVFSEIVDIKGKSHCIFNRSENL